MNPLTESFTNYLRHLSNFSVRKEEVCEHTQTIYDKLIRGEFLEQDFLERYEDYPKYDTTLRPINILGKYNLITIYGVIDTEPESMMSIISDPEIMAMKTKLDKYDAQNIVLDKYLQDLWFDNILNVTCREDKLEAGLSRTSGNFVDLTFDEEPIWELKNEAFFKLFAVFLMLNKNLQSMNNFVSNINVDLLSSLSFKPNYFARELKKYFASTIDQYSVDLSKYILLYTYGITIPADTLSDSVGSIIKKKYEEIISYYCAEMERDVDFLYRFGIHFVRILYFYLAVEFLRMNFNNAALYTDNTITLQNQLEQELFTKVIDENYNQENIKNYMYLIFYYKNQPRRFLNVYQAVLKKYVDKILYPTDISYLYSQDVENYLLRFFGSTNNSMTTNLNFDAMKSTLEEFLSGENIIRLLDENPDIYDFTFKTFISDLFESYVNDIDGSQFDVLVDELLDAVFKYLRDEGRIDYDFEYYQNKRLVVWFLKSQLRQIIFNGTNPFGTIPEELFGFLKYSIQKSEPNIDIDRVRTRSIQFVQSNVTQLHQFCENIFRAALNRKLFREHISYFLNQEKEKKVFEEIQ